MQMGNLFSRNDVRQVSALFVMVLSGFLLFPLRAEATGEDSNVLKGGITAFMEPYGDWIVKNGQLIMPVQNGREERTNIWLKNDYQDFILELDFKVSPNANSGIFLRTGDISDPVQTGIEIQIWDNYGKTPVDKHFCGSVYDIKEVSEDRLKKPGKWNHLKIFCRGSFIKVFMNKAKVVDINLNEWKEAGKNPDGTPNKFNVAYKNMVHAGKIGFQDHGGKVWFRNIKIKEFEDSAEVDSDRTKVSIEGEKFFINGKPTFEGREWQRYPVEGLLPNSRMVQGIFDDYNPKTSPRWAYPDTKVWDADRNTREFIAAMPSWRKNGLLAFTINMQGGSPMGYGNKGWKNLGYDRQGNPLKEYLARLEKIIRKADELGMVVILGYFYFGQDQYLENEQAVINATRSMTKWILDKGFENVLVELANEVNSNDYDHDILSSERIPELINMVKGIGKNGKRLLVSVSLTGKEIPTKEIVAVSDFVLLHGNAVSSAKMVAEMVNDVRALPTYRPMPIVFNEDDHFDFDRPENNFVAATKAYSSWGYFDFRMNGEGFENGFQSLPVDWSISSNRKKGFFDKMKEIFVD